MYSIACCRVGNVLLRNLFDYLMKLWKENVFFKCHNFRVHYFFVVVVFVCIENLWEEKRLIWKRWNRLLIYKCNWIESYQRYTFLYISIIRKWDIFTFELFLWINTHNNLPILWKLLDIRERIFQRSLNDNYNKQSAIRRQTFFSSTLVYEAGEICWLHI